MAGSTTYQYILNIRDNMSAALRRAGVQGSDTYNRLQTQQERLNRTASRFTSILGRIGVAFAAFELGKKIITAGADIEQTRVAFATFLGDVDKGNKMIADIQRFADVTPLESKSLQQNAKTLMGFGITAENIMPTLQMLGDISGGNAEKMQSLTLACAQMSSAGRLMGQDLLQMINAGFNPLQIISKQTGKSMADLKKEMEGGRISTDMVTSAFRAATSEGGLFYQMLEKQSQTVAGKWSTLMDTINAVFRTIGERLNPAIIKTIGILTRAANAILPALRGVYGFFKGFYDELQAGYPITIAAAGIITALGAAFVAYKTYTIAAAVATKLWAVAQGVLNGVMAVNPVFLIIGAIVALIAAIARVIYKTDGWAATWKATMEYIKLTFQQMGAWFTVQWLRIEDSFLTGFETIKRGWFELQKLWDADAANKGIAALQNSRDTRAAEILAAQGKVNDLAKARETMKVWQVSWNKDRKLSDLTTGIKKQLGLGSATPGSGPGAGPGTLDPTAITDTTKGIAEGGSRPTNINITLGNLVETLNVNTTNLREGANEIEQQVREALLRVLNSANGVAYGN